MYHSIAQSARSSFISGIAYWNVYWCLHPNTSANSAWHHNEHTGKTISDEWSRSLQICASRVLLVVDGGKNIKGPRNWRTTMSAAAKSPTNLCGQYMLLTLLAASTCSNVEYLSWFEYPYLDQIRTKKSHQVAILWMTGKIAHTRYLSLARLSCVFASFCKSHLIIKTCPDQSSRSCTHRLYGHDNHISGIRRAPCQ